MPLFEDGKNKYVLLALLVIVVASLSLLYFSMNILDGEPEGSFSDNLDSLVEDMEIQDTNLEPVAFEEALSYDVEPTGFEVVSTHTLKLYIPRNNSWAQNEAYEFEGERLMFGPPTSKGEVQGERVWTLSIQPDPTLGVLEDVATQELRSFEEWKESTSNRSLTFPIGNPPTFSEIRVAGEHRYIQMERDNIFCEGPYYYIEIGEGIYRGGANCSMNAEEEVVFESFIATINALETPEKVEVDSDYAYPSWQTIETYVPDNDPATDTWQDTLFTSDYAFERRTLMATREDFPEISYEKNCTDFGGCEYDLLNTDLQPNSYVWYQYNDIRLKLPYNAAWGNNTLAVASYSERSGDDLAWSNADVSILTGGPYVQGEGDLSWVPGKITINIATYDSFDDWYYSVYKVNGAFEEPRKNQMETGFILRSYEYGLGISKTVSFITYDNVVVSLHAGENVSFEQLEDIVRTIEVK